jgi:hypothetical protein
VTPTLTRERIEKPLHVQVGIALGWTDLKPIGQILLPGEPDGYGGRPPGNLLIGPEGFARVPRYDTWQHCGPLIEKYGIGLVKYPGFCKDDGCSNDSADCCDERCPCWHPAEWSASPGLGDGGPVGPTPLIAVCHLLIALKAAGEL